MSKQKSTTQSTTSTKPAKPSRKEQSAILTANLAKYGIQLRSLIWQKAIATATPELRQMLLAYRFLSSTVDQIIPP